MAADPPGCRRPASGLSVRRARRWSSGTAYVSVRGRGFYRTARAPGAQAYAAPSWRSSLGLRFGFCEQRQSGVQLAVVVLDHLGWGGQAEFLPDAAGEGAAGGGADALRGAPAATTPREGPSFGPA